MRAECKPVDNTTEQFSYFIYSFRSTLYIYHRHGQCCWKRYKSTFMKRSKMKGSSQSTWTLTPRTQNDTLYTLQVYLQFQQLISSAKHACHLSTFHAAASAIQILTYRYFCYFIYRAISISLAFFGRASFDKLKKINLVPVTCSFITVDNASESYGHS